MIKKIIYVLFSILFFSCERQFYTENIPMQIQDELSSIKGNKNEYPFTLNFPNLENIPVAKVKFYGMDFFMLIDTGAYHNYFFKKGIEKIQYKKNTKKKDYAKINKSVFYFDYDYSIVDNMKKATELDGVIGLDFLEKQNRIVIDYNRKVIKINAEFKKPMYQMVKKDSKRFYIDVKYDFDSNSHVESILDTGASAVVINDVLLEKKNELKLLCECCKKYSVNRMQIGNINYSNVPVYHPDSPNLNYCKNAEDIIKTQMIIGTPIFKDHLLYLDFTRNEFCIE